MLITDPNKLQKYSAENRKWQGIPSGEITKNGRIFVCSYSGGETVTVAPNIKGVLIARLLQKKYLWQRLLSRTYLKENL